MSMNTAELARCIASESEDPVKRFSRFAKMVGVLGVEPRTSSLSGTRSNQLSYTPISVWWSLRDSNPRHPACKADTLAN